jgi:crotonobetainyl-CoA:carnitine CoA-transferase CaiB-like acyl-CoA transferase
MPGGALSDLRVIEWGDGLAGAFAGKALADFGAAVIKVEPPEGDPARRRGPFPGDEPHIEKSGQFLYLNANKRGITLDCAATAGREVLRRLLVSADILLTDAHPVALAAAELDGANIAEACPRLVWTAITTFGLTGPYSGYKGSDLVAWHMGGTGYGTPFNAVTDLEVQPPVRGGGNQSDYLTGWTAASATMAAVFYRAAYGCGQLVDVARVDAVANMMRPMLAIQSYDPNLVPTSRTKAGSPWIYSCKDGHISCSTLREHWWTSLKGLMGNPDWAESEAFETTAQRRINADALDPLLTEWFEQFTRQELYERLQNAGVPCFPVLSMAEMVVAPQYVARGVIVEQEHPAAGTIRQPGAPIRYSGTPWALRRPAPLLGQHNEEILSGELGLAAAEIRAATAAAVPEPVA